MSTLNKKFGLHKTLRRNDFSPRVLWRPQFAKYSNKASAERLFLSTISPNELPELSKDLIGLWQILDYYDQRWKNETYFYELKKFWSFGTYQVRSHHEINGFNFLTNSDYSLVKSLPLIDTDFSNLRDQRTSVRKRPKPCHYWRKNIW